jgi:hypothetical protein
MVVTDTMINSNQFGVNMVITENNITSSLRLTDHNNSKFLLDTVYIPTVYFRIGQNFELGDVRVCLE